MLRGGDPVLHDLLELLGGHAGVRGHDDLARWPCSPPASAPFTSPLSSEANGSFVLPLGMLRRERLHAVEREEELEIHRLLGPERAVVVERGDALGGRHEVGRAFLRHLLDEGDDGFLRRAVVPRRQRIGGLRDCRRECQHAKQRRGDDDLLGYDLHQILLVLISPFIHRLGLITGQFCRKE